jgi:hypothetical protein
MSTDKIQEEKLLRISYFFWKRADWLCLAAVSEIRCNFGNRRYYVFRPRFGFKTFERETFYSVSENSSGFSLTASIRPN